MVNYGRKKWTILWTGFIFAIHLNFNWAVADGNIGCLFAESLCDDLEWCFDDFAFGVCLQNYGVQPEQLERQPLSEEQSSVLARMLEDLQGAGLSWEHPFVQCRIQGALYALRNNAPLPHNLCAGLTPDPQILDPQSPLAFVRFSPPTENFADEVYVPPPKKNRQTQTYNRQLDYAKQKKKNNSPPEIDPRVVDELGDEILRELLDGKMGEAPKMRNHEQNPHENIYRSHFKENDGVSKEEELLNELNRGENYNELPTTSFREVAMNRNVPEVYFYAHPRPLEDTNELPQELHPFSIQPNAHRHFGGKNHHPARESGVYTEGGVVYLPDRGNQEQSDGEDKEQTRNLLANMLGFTRHERLDVKKPGPPAAPPPSSQSPHEAPKLPTTMQGNKEVLPAHFMMDDSPKIKKVLHDGTDDDHGPHSVDMEYAHVIFKTPIDSWRDGARIVTALSEMLHMQTYFTHPRVDRHEVSFRVESNPEKKTAADIARAINDSRVRNNLSRRLGVVVVRAGVGDKTKEDAYGAVTSSKVVMKEEGPDVTHVMAYMFAGAGAAAVIVIVITLFLIKRHDRKRDKLSGINSGLAAADSCSKDYQELCRARMAGKGEGGNGGRITSLSKENEGRPPSSRSSTSSWSEEPVTNMDISTGHMVLTYMEDHLRNKGRLQREWEALCRYEAEPNAREAAMQKQCALFSRTGAPLPYDHSRVVLNHLSNADGLDYINASTITDHDPRAPAYVAAQGPTQATISHFWQMIWEQGAVVIVALCRLQENAEPACARYWPEEGAQVYHIYEVHLVSEHIWCDDYLVRSFYLKNLQTGETRTVTQFHFLSWPQTGIPTSAKALLEFRRKVNKSYRGRSCPIVVHSSNGAGRTGAYILLDLVLARMNKGAREIDIAATLEHLRDQRAGLVATRQQFEFVLMAVAEEVHAILKALPTATADKRDLDKDVLKEHPDTDDKPKPAAEADKKVEKK